MNNTKLKIAFSGPSGLGKTTLCKYVEENVNIPHLSTSAMDILSDYDKRTLKNSFRYKGTGHKEVINLSSKDPSFGFFFQNAVLGARASQIRNADQFVLDRCPIDNVAYLLSQVGHNLREDQVKKFIAEAMEIYQSLSHVILIKYSNDIPSIEDNNSRVPNRFFQQYISDVFMGVYTRYFANIMGPQLIILDFWNLDERKSTLRSFLGGDPQLDIEFKERLNDA